MENGEWITWKHPFYFLLSIFYYLFIPSLLETPSQGAYNPATNHNLTQNKMANPYGRKYIDRSM